MAEIAGPKRADSLRYNPKKAVALFEVSGQSAFIRWHSSLNPTGTLRLKPVPRSQVLEDPHDVVDWPGVAGRQELHGGAERLAFGGEVEARERVIDGKPFGGLML